MSRMAVRIGRLATGLHEPRRQDRPAGSCVFTGKQQGADFGQAHQAKRKKNFRDPLRGIPVGKTGEIRVRRPI